MARTTRRPRESFLRLLDDHELRLRAIERALRLGTTPSLAVTGAAEPEPEPEPEASEPEPEQ